MDRARKIAAHLHPEISFNSDLEVWMNAVQFWLIKKVAEAAGTCPMRGGEHFQHREPVRVLITGAAGQIAYSLIFQVASGMSAQLQFVILC